MPAIATDTPNPTHHKRAWPLVWVAILSLMTLVGCGSSSVVASTDPAKETDATNASEPNAPSSGDDVIPGSEEFGLTMEGLAVRTEQVQGAIGECMQAAGFEYVPVDFDTIRRAQAADGTLPGINDDDFLSQYGFGLSTLAGEPNAMVEIAKGQNAAIFDSLAPADQVAYIRTLLGENEEATFIYGLEEEDFSDTGGCTRTAIQQFFDPQEISGNYVNPGDTLIDNDPRMAKAITRWSACVAEEGYDYETPDDLEDDIVDRLEAILEDQDPSDLTGASSQALAELQGFERAVAPLAEECDDEFIGPVEEVIESELYGAPQG